MESNPQKTVNFIGWIIIVLGLTLVFEASSFAFLKIQQSKHPKIFKFSIDQYFEDFPQAELERYDTARQRLAIYAPDVELGWVRVPKSRQKLLNGSVVTTDTQGSRVIPEVQGPVLMSTYGDSFTEGLEVNDGETWQAYLAYKTKTKVLNFGVGGYGPDQALLYLERNLSQGVVTPIVMLIMINENMNRLMNTFRSFYSYPLLGFPLGFKPMFVERDGDFEIVNFTPESFRDRKELARAARSAAKFDAFYARRTEEVAFPYSLNAIGFTIRHGFIAKPDVLLGHHEAGRAKIGYIIERFQRLAERHGFTPVFVLLPQAVGTIVVRGGRDHYIADIVREKNHANLIYIDVVKELSGKNYEKYVPGFDVNKFIEITHASAYGNRAVAAVITARLADQLAAFTQGE